MNARTLACGLAAAALFPTTGALAAPQMLGLVATERAVPFACEGPACTAELTAFCLEEQRPVPLAGRAYRLARTTGLTLVVTGRDGRTRTIPAARLVRFVATRRGIAAVRVTLDRRALARLGAARIAIRVGANVSLVPVPRQGDAAPHGPRDIARAAGPLRAIGTGVVDRAGAPIGAIRIVNRVINRLPKRGRADERSRIAAWTAATLGGAAAMPGRGQARALYRQCKRWTATPLTPFSLRSCLEEEHKLLVSKLNKRYWDAARPGM